MSSTKLFKIVFSSVNYIKKMNMYCLCKYLLYRFAFAAVNHANIKQGLFTVINNINVYIFFSEVT